MTLRNNVKYTDWLMVGIELIKNIISLVILPTSSTLV
jgi:hypothetical protein